VYPPGDGCPDVAIPLPGRGAMTTRMRNGTAPVTDAAQTAATAVAARRSAPHGEQTRRATRWMTRKPFWMPGALLLGVDVTAFIAAMVLTSTVGPKTLTVAVLLLVFFHNADLYRARLSLSVLDDAPGILGRSLAAGAGAMILGGLNDGRAGTARLVTALVFGGLCLALRAFAYAVIRTARRRHHLRQRALFLGAGTLAGGLAANLLAHPEYGLMPQGLLDDDPLLREHERPVPVLGGYGDLSTVVLEHAIDVVVVTYGSVREPSMVGLLRACDRLACEIYFVPRLYELHSVTKDTEVLWGMPLIRLRRAPFRTGAWTAKRLGDVVISAVALVLLAPVLLVCGLASKLETGCMLFRQTRIGLDGQHFDVLKFCSLKPEQPSESSTNWNIGTDARVGPIGRILRRTSLDELPQLWNVFRGDMSLVGPRPERPYFVDEFTRQFPWYPARHRVPAGLTGWAQIHGLRGDTSIGDRAHFDNFYIENWSMWGDIKIIMRTVGQVLKAAGR
jgi:exopolysaccharide biosynthesis polyprenyl glycosylphosphotransferase